MFNVYKQDVCCRTQLHRQLASMLALLLLFHNVAGKETQKEVPTIQHITSCPDIGYYFKRDVILNAIDLGPCKLCFCQDNSTAVCWLRESNRCDPKHYTFTGRKKRDNRSRRSPGFTDIFFRDAAREVFNRQSPEQCKPHESSFSEGCPPADWCIGCTVCDCDSNGRWDCHTLSFCEDKKGKKQVKKKRNSQKSRIVKRQLAKTTSPPKTTKKPNKKPTKKPNKKQIFGKKPQMKQNKSKQNKNKNKNKISKKTGNTKKISLVKKSKNQLQKNKIPPKIKKESKKNVQKGKRQITVKSNKGSRSTSMPKDDHNTIQFTKMILKKVMASVNKVVSESHKLLTKEKMVQKSSMPKHINNKKKQSHAKVGNKVKKWQPMKNVPPNQKQKKSRRKRQITKDSVNNFEKEKITNFPPKIEDIVFSPSRKYNDELLFNERFMSNTSNKYFEYNVDSINEKNTMEINNSEKQVTNSQIILKSNNKVTINANNVTQTDSAILGFKHNGTRTATISSLNEFKLQNSSLLKTTLNNTSFKRNKSCGQICQLKKAFRILIGDFGKRNVTKKDTNVKNRSLMSYFRNFFRRLFQTSKKNNTSFIKKKVYRQRNIIKSLCKNITSCKFDPMDKTLQAKLDQLKIESNNILKSVRIIKGLLKLFGDRETSIIKKYSSIDNSQQNKDILILNTILKDKYNLASTSLNLTETQLKQIDYIRDNTKMFIQSIENFAIILNDIINLLRKSNKQKIARRKLRCTKHDQNESIKKASVGEKIKKLKDLLINYNLVQNRFMKGMFDVLGTLDPKPYSDNNKLAKVSANMAKYNENHVIENYTKNIINNLRKLKNLAEKLSFKNRVKRAPMGENDAIDYFLMLIEYLLKQNRPLDIPPVSDGIDLLIEAIKNSPDIKPIQKKVYEFVPLQATKTEAITTESVLVPPYKSEKKNNKTKITLKANKAIKLFESLDEDSEGNNIYDHSDKFQQKSGSRKENKFSDDKTTINILDVTTSIPKVYIARDNDEKINIVLDTFDMEKNDDKRGYEVFVDDTDEDESNVITSTQVPEVDTEIDLPVTENIPKRTTFPLNINDDNLRNSLNTLKAIKKTRLDWIEENISHEESMKEILDIKETTTQNAKRRVTRTFKIAATRYSNPSGSVSKETEDERQEKIMNPEYLMHKKQMNLLNSLDYGTEKYVLDSESKEEKFNSEAFPFLM